VAPLRKACLRAPRHDAAQPAAPAPLPRLQRQLQLLALPLGARVVNPAVTTKARRIIEFETQLSPDGEPLTLRSIEEALHRLYEAGALPLDRAAIIGWPAEGLYVRRERPL
jgi:hypothetical protein